MKTKLTKTAKCVICGKTFTMSVFANGKTCSAECRRIAKATIYSRQQTERKPRGMSEARWSIEKKRRMNKSYYATFGDPLKSVRIQR